MVKWVLLGGVGVVALLVLTKRETLTSIFSSGGAPPLHSAAQGLPEMLCSVGSVVTLKDSSAMGSPVMAGIATNCSDPHYGCIRATTGGTFCGDVV